MATITRAAVSLNRIVNGSCSRPTSTPTPLIRTDSTNACARPPSDRSCALEMSARAAHSPRKAASRRSSARRTVGGRPPRWRCSTHAQAEPSSSSSVAAPTRNRRCPGAVKPLGTLLATSSMTPSTPITGVGLIGGRAGLVVEADVAAGDRGAQGPAGLGEPAGRLGELPHHRRVLGRAEVEAVGHRERSRAGARHIAVGLGQRQLRTVMRVEHGEPAVAVERERDAARWSRRRAGRPRRRAASPARCHP